MLALSTNQHVIHLVSICSKFPPFSKINGSCTRNNCESLSQEMWKKAKNTLINLNTDPFHIRGCLQGNLKIVNPFGCSQILIRFFQHYVLKNTSSMDAKVQSDITCSTIHPGRDCEHTASHKISTREFCIFAKFAKICSRETFAK